MIDIRAFELLLMVLTGRLAPRDGDLSSVCRMRIRRWGVTRGIQGALKNVGHS